MDILESTYRLLSYFAGEFIQGREAELALDDEESHGYSVARQRGHSLMEARSRTIILRALYRRKILLRWYYAGGFPGLDLDLDLAPTS